MASGAFEPTDAFAACRSEFRPLHDGAGNALADAHILSGLRATTEEGVPLVGAAIDVCEYTDRGEPFAWEAYCWGVEHPPYHELFAHHVQDYEDQFKT